MQYLGNIENSLDSVNKEYVDKKHILASKTFTGVYLDNTSYPYWMMMRFIPKDNIGMWHIKYRMNVYTATASSTTRGKFIVEFFGYNRSVSASKIWNSFRDRPFYYNSLYIANSDANLLKYGIFAGVYFDNSNYATNTAYARTFEIDLLEAEGVEFSWLSNATRYNVATTMPVNGVDTSVTISSIGGASNYNGSSNGLQETGDSDSYYLGFINGARHRLHPDLRISRYTLCGFDESGRLMQFSWYTNGNTVYTNSAIKKSTGYRTYNEKGFDFSRGIFYYSSSSEVVAGSVTGNSIFYYFSAADFRYTDNCIASSTANSLGLVYNKPIYLRGTIGTDGLFYLAPIDVEYGSDADKTYQRVWTQDVPTADDGYVYWFVGYPYYNSTYVNSEYQLALSLDNKLYAYKNGLFKEFEPYIRLTEKALLFSDLSSNTTNPINITIGGTTKSIAQSTLRTSLGLKSAAYTESSAYATSAQGTKADNALPSASFTASNIVSTLGTTAVNRATADASGNNIVNTYATKTQLTNGSVTKVGTSTVGSTIRPIYLNGGTPTAVSSVGEAFLSWGGQNIASDVTPIDAACCDEFGHNKLAFLPASCLTVEYTNDGGTTWIDYGLTDAQKIAMMTTSGSSVILSKGTVSASAGTLTKENCGNYKLRFTISTRQQNVKSGILYTAAKKLLINYSTGGSTGGTVLVERQTVGAYNAVVDEYNSSGNVIEGTWITVGTYVVGGWSGWNSIPLNITYGGNESQTGNNARIRLIFGISDVSTNYSSCCSVIDFRLIGTTNWSMPSEMARAGRLYSVDTSQNATFPSNIYTRTNNTYDLGSNSSQFRYAYVGWVGSKAGNTFSIGANNGTAITINTSNNVSLSGPLTAKSAITIDSNFIGGADHLMFNRGSYNYIRASASGGCLAFVVNGVAVASSNTAFLIASNGNVSVGQSSGTTKLSVLGSQRLESSVSGAGGDVSLELWRGSNASFKFLNTNGILKLQSNYTTAKTSYFDVMQWNYNTGNVIVNKGNLGIGTTSPSSKLHITHSDSSATTPSLLVDNTYAATGTITSAFFKASALANGGIVRVAVGRDLSTRNTGFFEYVYNTTNTKSLFRFGLWGLSNPAIAIDGSSHIGIGATPDGDYGINMGDNTLKVGSIYDIGGMGLSIGDVTGGMPGIYSETYLELSSNSGIVISTNRKIYLCSEESDILSTTPYIEFDSTNNAFHFSHGIYSDSFISAEGLNAGGGSGGGSCVWQSATGTTGSAYLGNCSTGMDYSVAIGNGTTAGAEGCFASGYQTDAEGDYCFVEGYSTIVSGDYAHAEGQESYAEGIASHAEGYKTKTSGEKSHAEGSGTHAEGNYSHTEGYNCTTKNENVTKLPTPSTQRGLASHAEGNATKAYGNFSHAEGISTQAIYDGSHAEGWYSVAKGICSHAEGSGSTASGNYSHAENGGTTASGSYSHAEGNGSTASGSNSHAEGCIAKASGYASHAEGYNSHASGDCSHAEGNGSKASGSYSHAEGCITKASGDYSHAEGRHDTYVVSHYLIPLSDGMLLDNDGHYSEYDVNDYPYVIDTDSLYSYISYVASTLGADGDVIYNQIMDEVDGGELEILSYDEDYYYLQIEGYEGFYFIQEGDAVTLILDGEAQYEFTQLADAKNEANYAHSGGLSNGTASFAQTTIGHYCDASKGAGSLTTFSQSASAFIIGNGSSSGVSNAFRVNFDGKVFGGQYASSGADYAEYLEWEDGNPNNEDRIGKFVTLTTNGKIRVADANDDIIGVISGISSIIGNSAEDNWDKRYLRDVYGRPLFETVTVRKKIAKRDEEGNIIYATRKRKVEELDEGGNVVLGVTGRPQMTIIEEPTSTPLYEKDEEGNFIYEETTEERFKVNPEFDLNKKYIPRSQRKEWAVVGLLGQIIVEDDGTCVVGQRCSAADGGTATLGTKYRVVKRLDDTHIVLLANFL